MFWFGMILALILAQLPQVWSEWGFRITVISSIAANLVVGILSGTRRRSAPRWWRAILGEVAKGLLWLAYEGGAKAAESALGKLSLSDSDASEEEKQVAAFWGTFLLLHLGGPDNLTAYALEDNKMSPRKVFEAVVGVVGAIYTIYHNTHRGGRSWALLLAASVIMLVVAAFRYWERALALGKANLESMQEDASSTSSQQGDFGNLEDKISNARWQGRSFGDGEALLLAQDMFPIWRHALVDSSVDSATTSPRQKASEMILSPPTTSDECGWDWESMCSVAEMELSLIYELLYTKAILASTWYYYLIRLLSPLFTAAAAILFCSWHQQQQQGVRGSFVRITYALLFITFLMDVAWLLRALGSTWAYAYFQADPRRSWWCRIHRVVVWLDPLRLLLSIDPVSHRRWSGTIGRYNLLDECTAAASPSATRSCPEYWCRCLVSVPGDDKPKELRYLFELRPCVKEMVFKRVTKILQQVIKSKETQFDKPERDEYTRVDIRTHWGHKAFRPPPEDVAFRPARVLRAPEAVQNRFEQTEVNPFGLEFEEDVLLWHIATCMLLHLTKDEVQDAENEKRRAAIEVMSEYMMFLVAVRPKMLPGLALHSQLQATRKALRDVLNNGRKATPDYEKSNKNNKQELAQFLRFVRHKRSNDNQLTPSEIIEATEGTELLVHAVDIYFNLTDDDRPACPTSSAGSLPRAVVQAPMLEIIFNVWVDKLVYAAVRCSREAHAEQLSKGGDLTTVLWMLIQRAGPFYIRNAVDITLVPPGPAPPQAGDQGPPVQMVPWPIGGPPPEMAPPHMPMYPPSPLPQPPPCPVCPPYYYPSCPVCGRPPPCYNPSCPVCGRPPPCYNLSCPPVCPWCPECTTQHETMRGT